MKNWMMIIVSGLLVGFIAKLWREKQAAAVTSTSYLPIGSIWTSLVERLRARVGRRDDRLARLEEVLRTSELTNSSFFRSLEMVQKNLEAVIVRAENAEQRLHTLLTQTDLGKTDQYSSAVLLLSEGKTPEQVARMLSLPLHQIELVERLRQAVRKTTKAAGGKAAAARRIEKKPEMDAVLKKRTNVTPAYVRGENSAAHREKNAVALR
jgi:hypothetical protein